MSDPDVENEELANRQRKVDNERPDDDSVVDTVEEVINPITRVFMPDPADDEDVARQRQLNDAEQRPD